jgi:hypothetical protein
MTEHVNIAADNLPEGEFAIVEALGHRTLVGRVSEIERFGTKMLQVEPFFGDVMLGPVLLGGGSIYQFTPCSAVTAYARRPQQTYHLPACVAATVPPIALPSNEELPLFLVDDDDDDPLGDGSDYGLGGDWSDNRTREERGINPL